MTFQQPRNRALAVMAGMIVGSAVAFCAVAPVMAQAPATSKQKQQIRRMDAGISRAGRLFQNKKYAESAKLIQQIQTELVELTRDAGESLIELAKPLHERLTTAHRMLVDAGQQLPALKPLPPPTTESGEAMVSFTTSIASVLNAKCGNCHVRRSRGNFSMASYQSLMSGLQGAPVVVPKKPDESYLIEVIESGDMPQGGQTVTDDQLKLLKQWIAQGARFDGDAADANLATLVGATEPRRPATPEIARPRGNETVSFSLDVAPVLVDRCNGCHFEPQNARGGFNMTVFRQLMQGGDSGPVISPGSAADSLMVQHLKGSDGKRIMPPTRGPLEPEIIEKIETWINEGARFDGRQANMNLRNVSAIAKAESASHEQLAIDRQAAAARQWKMVMSDIESHEIASDNFLLLGAADAKTLKRYGDFAESTVSKIKPELKIGKNDRLVKGKISLFIFERRYDYNEFGKMIEGRDLPKSWRSHWGYDTVNAYAAILNGESQSLDSAKPQLTQRIAALAVANLAADVPPWFANGVGYAVAERIVDDNEVVKQWRNDTQRAVQSMQRPTDFVENRIPEDDAALVGYAFVKMLMENRRQFNKLLRAVRESGDFNASFVDAYTAEPAELINAMFGTPNPQNRRRSRGGNRRR